MTWRITLAVIPAFVAAACAGAAPAQPEPDQQTTAPTGAPAAPVPPTGGAPAPPVAGGEPNTAVVTIGEERFELSGLRCVSLGGAVGVQTVEGPDYPRIDISLPPPDWESSADDWDPPSVRVIADEDDTWIANPEATALINIEPGLSQVDSFSSDGFQASGTATFMNAGDWQAAQMGLQDEPPDPVDGAFQLTCPQDR